MKQGLSTKGEDFAASQCVLEGHFHLTWSEHLLRKIQGTKNSKGTLHES